MGKRSDELDRTDPPAPVAGAPMGIADVGVVVAADDVIPKFVVETPDVVVVVGAVEVVDPTAVVVVVPPTTVVVEVVPPTAVVVPPTAVVVVVVDPTAVVVPQTVVVVVGFVVVVVHSTVVVVVGFVVVVVGFVVVVVGFVVVVVGFVVVVVASSQVGTLTLLSSMVTAPPNARARPLTVAPVVNVIDVVARIVPAKLVYVPRVAELPTCQNTLHAWAPFSKATVLDDAVVRVDPA
jgi:hypothetical protein